MKILQFLVRVASAVESILDSSFEWDHADLIRSPKLIARLQQSWLLQRLVLLLQDGLLLCNIEIDGRICRSWYVRISSTIERIVDAGSHGDRTVLIKR